MHWLVFYNDLLGRLNQAFFMNDPKITDIISAPGLIMMDGGNRHKYELAQFTHLRFFFFQQMFRILKNVYMSLVEKLKKSYA